MQEPANVTLLASGIHAPALDAFAREHVELTEAIEHSRYILSLDHDWDDEGAPRYQADTWLRTTEFLRLQYHLLWHQNHRHIHVPKILPGPDGSIDLHWKTRDLELLINIPRDDGEPAPFYGDRPTGQIVKGHLDTSKAYLGLMVWLMQET